MTRRPKTPRSVLKACRALFGYYPFKNCHPERSEGSAVGGCLQRLATMAACLGISVCSIAQMTAEQWHTFDSLCGKLEYRNSVPERKNPQIMNEKKKSLSKVPLQLFRRQEGIPCCSGLPLVEAVTTKRGGNFEFKEKTPGKYFVVANWNGSTHSMELTIDHDPKFKTACSDQGLQIKSDGTLEKFETVTVD